MKTILAITQIPLLIVSGAMLIAIGISITVSPVDFYASNNISPGSNISLLNELKAPAGLLLAAGIFMITATFMRSKTDSALWLAALIYLSYAFSRLVSMAFDGLPASGLVAATVVEAIIGLACLAVWVTRKTPNRKMA